MSITRLLRHFAMTHWYMRSVFSASVLDAITSQIKQCESTHGGEIRVVVEADLSTRALLRDQSSRERATDVFAHLHMWDTQARNGVLIYLCLADRAIEIIADRGFEGKITSQQWTAVCEALQRACSHGQYQQALCDTIQAVSKLIAMHYPKADGNELPDRPMLL